MFRGPYKFIVPIRIKRYLTKKTEEFFELQYIIGLEIVLLSRAPKTIRTIPKKKPIEVLGLVDSRKRRGYKAFSEEQPIQMLNQKRVDEPSPIYFLI